MKRNLLSTLAAGLNKLEEEENKERFAKGRIKGSTPKHKYPKNIEIQ